ncbi:unnamed protein product [Pedinophyceae sp. YPF-701]|nr:unnamed protein product [Pedinophyceae sp. YPF-701]
MQGSSGGATTSGSSGAQNTPGGLTPESRPARGGVLEDAPLPSTLRCDAGFDTVHAMLDSISMAGIGASTGPAADAGGDTMGYLTVGGELRADEALASLDEQPRKLDAVPAPAQPSMTAAASAIPVPRGHDGGWTAGGGTALEHTSATAGDEPGRLTVGGAFRVLGILAESGASCLSQSGGDPLPSKQHTSALVDVTNGASRSSAGSRRPLPLYLRLRAVATILDAKRSQAQRAMDATHKRLREVTRDLAHHEFLLARAAKSEVVPPRVDEGAAPPGLFLASRQEVEFRLTLLASLERKLRMKLGMMALASHRALQADRALLVARAFHREEADALRYGFEAFRDLLLELRAKEELADRVATGVLGAWSEWATNQARAQHALRVARAMRSKMLKRSALAHWATATVTTRQCKLQEAVSIAWDVKSRMLHAFTAWRDHFRRRQVLRQRLDAASAGPIASSGSNHLGDTTGGSSAARQAMPAFPSLLRQLAHGYERLHVRFAGPREEMLALSRSLQRLAPSLRFCATEEDVMWGAAAGRMLEEARREERRAGRAPRSDEDEPAHRLSPSDKQRVEAAAKEIRGRLYLGQRGRDRLVVTERHRLRLPERAPLGDVASPEAWATVQHVVRYAAGLLNRERTVCTAARDGAAALATYVGQIDRGDARHAAFLSGALTDLADVVRAGWTPRPGAEARRLTPEPPPGAAAATDEVARLAAELGAQSGGLLGAISPGSCVRQAITRATEAGVAAREAADMPEGRPGGVAGGVSALATDVAACLDRLRVADADSADADWPAVRIVAERLRALAARALAEHTALAAEEDLATCEEVRIGATAAQRSAASRDAAASLARQADALTAAMRDDLAAAEAEVGVAANVVVDEPGGEGDAVPGLAGFEVRVDAAVSALRARAAERHARADEIDRNRARLQPLLEQAMEASAAAGEARREHRWAAVDAQAAMQRLREGLEDVQGLVAGTASASLAAAVGEARARVEDAEADEVRAFEVAEGLTKRGTELEAEAELERDAAAADTRQAEALLTTIAAMRELAQTRGLLQRGLSAATGAAQGGAMTAQRRAEAAGAAARLAQEAAVALETAWRAVVMPWDVALQLRALAEGVRAGVPLGNLTSGAPASGLGSLSRTAAGAVASSTIAGATRYFDGDSDAESSDGEDDDDPAARFAVLYEIGFDYLGGCVWLPWSRFAPGSHWAFDADEDDWLRPIPRPRVHFFTPSGRYIGSIPPPPPSLGGSDPFVRAALAARAAAAAASAGGQGTSAAYASLSSSVGAVANLAWPSIGATGSPGAGTSSERLWFDRDDGSEDGRAPTVASVLTGPSSATALTSAAGTSSALTQGSSSGSSGRPRVPLNYQARTVNGAATMVYLRGLSRRVLAGMRERSAQMRAASDLAEGRAGGSYLRHWFLRWRGWPARRERLAEAFYRRRTLEVATRGWLLVVLKAADERAATLTAREFHEGRSLRAMWDHWRSAARARRLLTRVLGDAQERWAGVDVLPSHRAEFETMERAFAGWRQVRHVKEGRREELRQRDAADAWRDTHTKARTFVDLREHTRERVMNEIRARRAFRCWRRYAEDVRGQPGHASARRKLRDAGYANEVEYHERLEARRERNALARGFRAWREAFQAGGGARIATARTHRLRVVFRALRQGCAESREADDERIAPHLERWRERRPRRKAFCVWRAVARELRERRRDNRVADDARRATLLRHAFRALAWYARMDDEGHRSDLQVARAHADRSLLRRMLPLWAEAAGCESALRRRRVEAALEGMGVRARAGAYPAKPASAPAPLPYWRGVLPRQPTADITGPDVDTLTQAMSSWKVYSRMWRERDRTRPPEPLSSVIPWPSGEAAAQSLAAGNRARAVPEIEAVAEAMRVAPPPQPDAGPSSNVATTARGVYVGGRRTMDMPRWP